MITVPVSEAIKRLKAAGAEIDFNDDGTLVATVDPVRRHVRLIEVEGTCGDLVSLAAVTRACRAARHFTEQS